MFLLQIVEPSNNLPKVDTHSIPSYLHFIHIHTQTQQSSIQFSREFIVCF